MIVEEYKAKLKAIESTAASEKQKLAREYAFSNSDVKKGDVIADSVGTILVDKIQFTSSGDMPQCVYTGNELTKKNQPRRDGKRKVIFHRNIISK